MKSSIINCSALIYFINYFNQFVSSHEISQEAPKLFEEYDNKHNMNFYSTINEIRF